MPGMPGFASAASGSGDPTAEVMQRITDLESQVKQLAAANPFNNATINNSGITITETDGTPVAKIGIIDSTGRRGIIIYGGGNLWIEGLDGSYVSGYLGSITYTKPQMGLQLQRQKADGTNTTALAIADFSTSGPINQQTYWLDEDRYVVVGDDASGSGLSAPTIPYSSFVDDSAVTATTTSPTFVNIGGISAGQRWNPHYAADVVVQSNGTATGEVRMVDGNGTVIGAVQTIASGDFSHRGFSGPMPGTTGSQVQMRVQARMTGGTGSIGILACSASGASS